MPYDITSILNTVWDNASVEYQTRIPQATADNIAAIGNALTDYEPQQNEFLNQLINRIGLVIIRNKTASNPLSVLKKGGVPLGRDIQEIFTNMAKAETYDATGSTLLNRKIPDVKAIYHRMNRQDKYKVTVSQDELLGAFTSREKLSQLIDTITNSLYSGDNFDEFVLTKNLFAQSIEDGKITTVQSLLPVDETSAKRFVKDIQKVSRLMTFPSTAFNKYIDFANTGDTTPVTTWAPTSDQILVLRADLESEINIEVLAYAFNMNKADFMASRVLLVDSFGTANTCMALLMDKSAIQIYDNNYRTTNFWNPEGLYWNYMLHHWQTYSLSLFANAVAFMQPPVPVSGVTVLPATATMEISDTLQLEATVAPENATNKLVGWNSSAPAIATVSATGLVTAVDDGTATITAMTDDGDFTDTCVVTVEA